MARIEFQHVTKVFEGNVTALEDLSLTVEDGEFLVLVGPSGCGKSTALRLIAGLERATGGVILADGEPLNELPPQERNVAVVFQNYALYPHKTVRQNLEFPLRMMKLPKRARLRKVAKVAELLGLGPFLDRSPKELSGGQQQRVAMGRAIVREPIAFLMDEPLSNLDAKLRVEIRAQIADLQQRLGTTTVYVTHDQIEAMTLGHRVGVLRNGRLQQIARSSELYDRPANVFVATFIGSPRMNVFWARLEKTEGGEVGLRCGDHRWIVPHSASANVDLEAFIGAEILAGLRPEAFHRAGEDRQGTALDVTIRAIEALGHECVIYGDCSLNLLSDDALARINGERNQAASSHLAADRTAPLTVRLPAGEALNRGDRLRLEAETERLHLFDGRGNAIARRQGTV
jgi:multiple sugar transport system ATP-binding protein